MKMPKRDKLVGRFGATHQQGAELSREFFAIHAFLKFEENSSRFTEVADDVAFAHELMTSNDLDFERRLLWKAVDHCLDMDGIISPSALKTDFKRELKSNYRESDGVIPPDARRIIAKYSNDHVITPVIRYIVSDDPEYYREYFQINHANCDLLLCSLFKDTFKWLLDERFEEEALMVEGSPWRDLRDGKAVQLSIFDGYDECA